jgi:hypothetical protein
MLKSRLGLAFAGALVVGASLMATEPASAAGGCGPGSWRGPWGHCRNTPYTGPLPGGGYQVEFRRADNGCPPIGMGPTAIAVTHRFMAACQTATGSNAQRASINIEDTKDRLLGGLCLFALGKLCPVPQIGVCLHLSR